MKFRTNSGNFWHFPNFYRIFFKITRHFVISWPFLWNSGKISSNFRRKIAKSIEKREWNEMIFFHSAKNVDDFLLKFWDLSGAKVWESCRSRKMLQNEYLVAIVAVHTAENETLKIWGVSFHFFNHLLSTLGVEYAVVSYSNASAPWSNFIVLVFICIDTELCKTNTHTFWSSCPTPAELWLNSIVIFLNSEGILTESWSDY